MRPAGRSPGTGEVRFQTKGGAAQALADGVAPGVALMDPAYGNDSKLRAGISGLGLTYVAGMMSTTMVWRPSEAPLPAASRSGRGRPGTRLRRDKTHQPVAPRHWPCRAYRPAGALASVFPATTTARWLSASRIRCIRLCRSRRTNSGRVRLVGFVGGHSQPLPVAGFATCGLPVCVPVTL